MKRKKRVTEEIQAEELKRFNMDPVISVSNLSKAYRIGLKEETSDSLVGAISGLLKSPLRNLRNIRRLNTYEPTDAGDSDDPNSHQYQSDLHWALREVNFQVQKGEVVGIIGHNGAGKSTLLKILSRITEPTSGRVLIRGRVSSLLEVGTGFHPDLSGRENVYLNGTILGMTKREIDRKFDEIVEFSGVERFLDTPTKRYSSGMKVRLAFAVAAFLEPEILIIDEVLAVGDAQFQKKCLGKMGEVANGGRTVLFVSHNMTAVRTLCQRTILLDGGRVQRDGDTPECVTAYYRNLQEAHKEAFWDRSEDAPGDEVLRIRSVRISALEGVIDGSITMEDEIQISTDYWILQPGETCHITYHLINHEGVTVLTTGNKPSVREIEQYQSSFVIPPYLLNSGTYFLKLLIVRNENSVSRVFDSIATFEVIDAAQRETACVGREPSVVCPRLVWTEN